MLYDHICKAKEFAYFLHKNIPSDIFECSLYTCTPELKNYLILLFLPFLTTFSSGTGQALTFNIMFNTFYICMLLFQLS